MESAARGGSVAEARARSPRGEPPALESKSVCNRAFHSQGGLRTGGGRNREQEGRVSPTGLFTAESRGQPPREEPCRLRRFFENPTGFRVDGTRGLLRGLDVAGDPTPYAKPATGQRLLAGWFQSGTGAARQAAPPPRPRILNFDHPPEQRTAWSSFATGAESAPAPACGAEKR